MRQVLVILILVFLVIKCDYKKNYNSVGIYTAVIDSFYINTAKKIIKYNRLKPITQKFVPEHIIIEPGQGYVSRSDFERQFNIKIKSNADIDTSAMKDIYKNAVFINAKSLPKDKSELHNYFNGLMSRYSKSNGILFLSDIFFYEENKAIVYYEKYNGPKSGIAEVVFLVKSNEVWHIEKSELQWQS